MAYREGFLRVAGVDEAGRGPLAGPVVAAACFIPHDLDVEGVGDSKKLTARKREELYHTLINHPDIDIGIGIVDHSRIDQINILRASLEAMALAVQNMSTLPDILLVDGREKPPIQIVSKTIIKGDSLSRSIGAASIVAKHTRDVAMLDYHKEWPEYGFDSHKGYPTKAHINALKEHGPTPIHRLSFRPVQTLTSY